MITRSGHKAGQNEFELSSMIELFRACDIRSYLEVGARYGDTFYEVMRSLPRGSTGVCVDLPGDVWGTQGSESDLQECCDELTQMGYDIHCLIGRSDDDFIVDNVWSLGPFDAALLDGDHRYEGIKRDFELYSPLCDIVALHDIVGDGQRHGPGIHVEVPRFWGEIKNNRCVEYVDIDSVMGIGVWRSA